MDLECRVHDLRLKHKEALPGRRKKLGDVTDRNHRRPGTSGYLHLLLVNPLGRRSLKC